MNETVEFPLAYMNLISICDVSYGQVFTVGVCVMLKDRKRVLSGKTTTTRCGIRETATTRNCVLWLFLNNHNALWHERNSHNAKCLLNELFISLVIY